jgi:hypothetical protein
VLQHHFEANCSRTSSWVVCEAGSGPMTGSSRREGREGGGQNSRRCAPPPPRCAAHAHVQPWVVPPLGLYRRAPRPLPAPRRAPQSGVNRPRGLEGTAAGRHHRAEDRVRGGDRASHRLRLLGPWCAALDVGKEEVTVPLGREARGIRSAGRLLHRATRHARSGTTSRSTASSPRAACTNAGLLGEAGSRPAGRRVA